LENDNRIEVSHDRYLAAGIINLLVFIETLTVEPGKDLNVFWSGDGVKLDCPRFPGSARCWLGTLQRYTCQRARA
jgi:hypothetical protein